MREVLNALVSVLRGGGQWRLLPLDLLPYQTVYHDVGPWRWAGGGARMQDTRRGALRAAAGRSREPRAGIIARQRVKTTAKGGAGAMPAASAAVGASGTSWLMSSGSCSW